ncbi:MAG: guanylate kinase [Actinomycetaceae bacterium]|nr:guanylate kinase [Actinomycetaceae bacterium]MDY6083166.1 guanylate kinase [Actinomycetaceae bacterium]
MGLDSTTRDADRRPEKQRFFVLTGPSGVGKGTVEAAVRAMYPDLWISTSVTTRSPRTGEVDGQHYFFVDDAKFDQMIANGDLLEWATVHGTHRYGTPKAAVRDALGAGKTVLLEIDLDGARQIRASEPEVYEIFLAPPTWDTLRDRLAGRGTESEDERERRLETAKVELAAESEFDEIVINDDIDRTAHEVARIMGLEKPAASGEN